MKTLKVLSISCILLMFTLSSCTFNTTLTNRESDKLDAQKITDKFYALIKTGNYTSVHDLFSDEFWKVTPPAKMDDIFTTTQKKLGDFISNDLTDWQTRVVSGTDPSSEYKLVYKSHRQKYDCTETFGLVKEKDGKIRILSYNINSEGFFK